MPHEVGGKVDSMPNDRAAGRRRDGDGRGRKGAWHENSLIGSGEASGLRRVTDRRGPSGPKHGDSPRGGMALPTPRRPGASVRSIHRPPSRRPATDPAADRRAGPDRLAHPAAPLRAVGAVRLAADRGPRRRGARRHAVRHRRLGHRRHGCTRTSPTGWSEDDHPRPEGRRVPAHRLGVRARRHEFDIIHNGFDFLPLTYSGSSTRRWSPRSTGSRRPRSSRLRALRRHHRLRRDQRRRPPPGAALRRHDPPRHRHRSVRLHPSPGRPPAVLRAHPPRQGHRAAIEVARSPPGSGSTSPASSRTRTTSGRRSNRTSTAPGPLPGERSDGRGAVRRCLGDAHALLHLIDFDEPFGFSVVEAMACGTPVIAHDRGSMPELCSGGVPPSGDGSRDAAVPLVG
jgi:hypothetical protein